MEIRLQRSTWQARGPNSEGEEALLEAAGKMLKEAFAHLGLDERPNGAMRSEELRHLRNRLAERAWQTEGKLPGEAPVARLHPEVGDWGPRVGTVPGPPWLVVAVDVLDLLDRLMCAGDELHFEDRDR